MPANLTPDYDRADLAYKAATTDEARILALREMYATIPKHKGTEKLQADIKHKLSQLRKAESKKPSRGPDPFYIPRSGAGQVVLIGTPNVGKSLLVAKTTHAPVKVAEFPFTTVLPVPGMASTDDVQIELIDTPPVTADHVPTGLMGTINLADIIAIVVDASEDSLEEVETVMGLLESRGLILKSLPHNELDPSTGNEHTALIVANKIDLAAKDNVDTLRELYHERLEVCPISAETGEGVPQLLHRFWELLACIRVYTREPGQHHDTGKPFVLELGATVEDLATHIHQDLPSRMKFARIWREGAGAHFQGQPVHRTEVLLDKDIVEIHQ